MKRHCAGFAPITASPWPLYQPQLTHAALLLQQWQLQQQAAAQQVRDRVNPQVDRRWDFKHIPILVCS
jgi:hypothetical protein